MRAHHSYEGQAASGGKFYIRYEETRWIPSRREKSQQKEEEERKRERANRGLFQSQITTYSNEKVFNHTNLPRGTQRLKEKKRAFTNMNMVGSLTQLGESSNERLSGNSERQTEMMRNHPRIPIQYNDEKMNGTIADYLRMKVVYRGYNPKNTYYFIKHLEEGDDQEGVLRGQFQLRFDGKFESGNLSVAARKSSREFWIFMREDTNTRGLRQWFYFSVMNRKAGRYKFRIYKFSKRYSLYKEGMKPFCCINNLNNEWHQAGENVQYVYDKQFKCYFLEFEYIFQHKQMKIWFASQPPYTYTMLKNFLASIVHQPFVEVKKIGNTLAGFDIPMIKISQENHKKQAIIILARTHPSETASNFTLEAFVRSVLESKTLKSMYNFYIVPMVNPDGVYFGNHRTSVTGQDVNRNFRFQNLECFPEIQAINNMISGISTQSIRYLFDLHGHSARRNIFAYGDEEQISSNRYLHSRIIPKILSNLLSSFRYSYCVFKKSKQKKNAARIYFSKTFRFNALTFQQSYGLLDDGCIGIRNWRQFGKSLAQSLQYFGQMYKEGQKRLVSELECEIEEDTIKQREKLERKLNQKNEKIDRKEISKTIDYEIKNHSEALMKLKTEKFLQTEEKYEDEISISSSQLSSGDEELQIPDEELEIFRKQIIKIGCMKEGVKRETYIVAEKNLQIKNRIQNRMHEQRSSIIPRILKFQMKKKDLRLQPPLNFKGSIKERSEHKYPNSFHQSVELPSLKRKN